MGTESPTGILIVFDSFKDTQIPRAYVNDLVLRDSSFIIKSSKKKYDPFLQD